MILLFLYHAHFEVILLQVCCTFCGLAQWEDVILVVEGDILQVSYYLACRIQFLEGGGGNYIPKTFASFFFTFSFVFTLRFKQSSRITSFSLQCCVGWAILIKNIFCSITPCTRMIRAVTVIWEHTIVRRSTFFTVLVSLSSWR